MLSWRSDKKMIVKILQKRVLGRDVAIRKHVSVVTVAARAVEPRRNGALEAELVGVHVDEHEDAYRGGFEELVTQSSKSVDEAF